MELFPVDRYVEKEEDDDDDDDENEEQNSAEVLKRLRKEEKRRRKALEAKELVETEEQNDETEQQNGEFEEQNDETETKSKKRKKKNKHQTENGDLTDENNFDEDEITPKIKKKKKHQENEIENGVLIDEYNIDEVEIAPKMKKKKKHQENETENGVLIDENNFDEDEFTPKKKKKAKNQENETENGVLLDEYNIDEDEFTPKKKKKAKNQENETENGVLIDENYFDEAEITPKIKKKQKHQENEIENGVLLDEYNIDEAEIAPKTKKKKKHQENETENGVLLDENNFDEAEITPKIKKKQKHQENETENGVLLDENNIDEAEITPKIKKKKKHQENEIENGVLLDEYNIDEAEIAPKMKKKKKHQENETENGVLIDENNIDEAEITPKLKKKKKHQENEIENGVLLDENNIDEDEITPKKKKKQEEIETENVKEKKKQLKKAKQKANKSKKTDTDRDFMVIGEVSTDERIAVKRVLPDWLAKPAIFSMDLQNNLSEVDSIRGLCPSIVAQLRANKITHFFPVQSSIIPVLLDGFKKNFIRQSDLCISSPTGSGKTLAFALPIIHALNERLVCSIKALIVLPVVDLAMQVFDVFKTYTKGTYLRVGLAIGERSFNEEQQTLVKLGKRSYFSKIDILVCTPGRLVDHLMNTPGFSLIDLRFLVIDEADRIMQQVKQDWLNVVEKHILNGRSDYDGNVANIDKMSELRKMPQKLLFSATLSQNPEKLQEMRLFQPRLFASVETNDVLTSNSVKNDKFVTEFVGRYTTPKELDEFYVVCELRLKPLILLHFLIDLGYRHMLCFTNSVTISHRLYMFLSAYGGIRVTEITSTLTKVQRSEALKKFTLGLIDVIVCSDTLARGMDIENVDYVVSYDCPRYLKSYIHRVGRTARAGRSGTAISLVETNEVSEFNTMMETGHKSVKKLSIEMKKLESMEELYKNALEQVKLMTDEERIKKLQGNEKRRIISKKKRKINKNKLKS